MTVRTPVLAAGGIVLRSGPEPLFAVVRLRKRSDWVLPKGKLDVGETPRAAAEREVLEETGHRVEVREFVGTLAYESGGRSKVVHFWRMEAAAEQTLPLTKDVCAVAWLPLDRAVERLSRGYEQAFLGNVGPMLLEAAATAEPRRVAGRAGAFPARCPSGPVPADEQIVAELTDAPSLALERPSESITPTLLQRIRRWLGTSR